jgi:hypothetical protein
MSASPFALNSMMSRTLFAAIGVLFSLLSVNATSDRTLRFVQMIELGKSCGTGAYTRVNSFHFDDVHVTLQDTVRGTESGSAKNRPILQQWKGDYPVLGLNRLPKGQRNAPVGYIGDIDTFQSVWQAFMPGTISPKVDFAGDLIVFARNVRFYNSTSIASVKDEDGMLEVIAIETMSSLPIQDKVSFAMALISREGAISLKTGNKSLRIFVGGKT